MVDCRAGAGAAPHEMAHSQPNGGPAPSENHHVQSGANAAGGGGDMGALAHGVASPGSARASTPATTNSLTNYTGGGGSLVGPPGYGPGYVCGMKSVLWCAPQSPPVGPNPGPPLPPLAPLAPPPGPHVPPPPHGVNPNVYKSVQPNGADLPMNDIPTLRYYFNLGVECMWAAYGPPPPHAPGRHYSPRDIAQDMQQMSIHERPNMNHNSAETHKHNKPGPPNDKPQINNQGKGNGQRPLLGPRFKRGGNNQDGGGQNHNQNKHNNNMANKGPNNRRNSYADARAPAPLGMPPVAPYEGECLMEQPLLTLPYIPYPPPLYPVQYYPMEGEPAMMGMMSGMGYVGYEEGEFAPYYPHYAHPPHAHAPHHPQHPHIEHK